MNLLIPGRHHILTDFQFRYLFRFVQAGLSVSKDLSGNPLPSEPLDAVIFAVTSSNHSGTRRNPLSLFLRSLQIQTFGSGLGVPVYVYGIPDVGERKDFAGFVLKTIRHESSGRHDLTPANTVVACSTPVLNGYRDLGFTIFGAELDTKERLPWELVETIAQRGLDDPDVLDRTHPSSILLWKQYRLDEKVKTIFADPMIGSDGDLTESRDYSSYVRQMDEIADLKFNDTEPFLLPGRIGDIGCAVGSWIKRASLHPRFRDSDFYGIELARPLFEICRQRKENAEFGTPNVFFSQRNAVTGLCFPESSMSSIHTSSLTHEIWSYGGQEQLLAFIQNRQKELAHGGVWINRDVIGVRNPQEPILIELPKKGSDEIVTVSAEKSTLKNALDQQSLWTRFRQFAQDFRPGADRTPFEIVEENRESVAVWAPRGFVQDFLMHKDYTDNWLSEMHETFTFWSFEDWNRALHDAGLTTHGLSRAFTNPWIRDQRWLRQVRLWDDRKATAPADWFPTTMVLIAHAS